MKYDGNKWKLVDKEDLIDEIYDKKKEHIEDNYEEYLELVPRHCKNGLTRWIETNDENDPKIKKVKGKIKLLLYNDRKLPMVTKKKIEDNCIVEEKVVKKKGNKRVIKKCH